MISLKFTILIFTCWRKFLLQFNSFCPGHKRKGGRIVPFKLNFIDSQLYYQCVMQRWFSNDSCAKLEIVKMITWPSTAVLLFTWF